MKRSAMIAVLVVAAGCTTEKRDDPSNPDNPNNTPSQTQQPLSAFRPVVGGHLSMTADARRVLLADPEAERLRIIDAATGAVIEDVTFAAGSWPTRAIEVSDGNFQVLLRGTGSIATVTLNTGAAASVTTTAVCPEPRSLTRDAARGETLVACAGGELVHVGATQTTDLTGVELRDVVIAPTGLVATSFRAAELIDLSTATPTRTKLATQRISSELNPVVHVPQVAWKMTRGNGASFVVHQLHADQINLTTSTTPNPIPNQGSSSPYGGGPQIPIPGIPAPCSASAVVTGVTRMLDDGTRFTAHTNDILPVDAAVSPDGSMLAIVGAGGTGLSVYPTSLVAGTDSCMTPTGGVGGLALNSVTWLSNTRLVVLETLHSTPMVFDLSTGLAKPLGTSDKALSSPAHTLFHNSPRGGAALACASCHPEGGEDGHLWIIDGQFRRTQTLSGGVMQRAPFHWRGDLNNLSALMTDTFVKRMGAAPVASTEVAGLGSWLDTIPGPKPSRTLSALQRDEGIAAFNKAGCASCHLSNGTAEGPEADIGTGEAVRSPNLKGVAARAPYLHTGEIPDLRSRITGSLHPNHGNLSVLAISEKESLIAYLESL